MTQEEKELLLKDLCAKLPYGVKLDTPDGLDTLGNVDINEGWINASYDVDEVKPYLLPMSSMTEEEREEYINIKKGECNGCVLTGKGDLNTEFLLVDFLNSHHFDYRGLIEKGLALEAPEGMYN